MKTRNNLIVKNELVKTNDEDWNKLKLFIKEVEKTFGKGSVILDDKNKKFSIETISTGSILLNKILGIGGYPKGRIVEIYGPESSGKTTFCLQAIAEVQKTFKNAAFIDAEHAFNLEYAKKIGVNEKKLVIVRPQYGEQAFDILEVLLKSKKFDLIVIDSVSALIPKKELESDINDQFIGNQAKLMSKALRKLVGLISNSNCLVIFINQLREKIGVFFGNPETTSGGRALKFYSSLRLDLRKIESVKDKNNNFIGANIRVRIVKNKLAPPLETAVIRINFNNGIDQFFEILNLALKLNLIVRKGTYYYEGNTNKKIAQGKEQLLIFLKKNNKYFENLKKIIISKLKV